MLCRYWRITASWGWIPLNHCYDPLNELLNSVCWYFAEGFCTYGHQWYWPIICMCVISLFLVWGCYLIEKVWKCSSAIFQKSFKEYVLSLPWMFRIHLWSHVVLDFCLLGVVPYSVSLLEIGLFRFFFLPCSVSGDGTFLIICPCPLSYLFHWLTAVCSILLRSFIFLWC